jgi:hypothetical protein
MKDAGWLWHGVGKVFSSYNPDNPFDKPEYFANAKITSQLLGVFFKQHRDVRTNMDNFFPKMKG